MINNEEKFSSFDLQDPTQFANACAFLLDDKKGKNIVIVDLKDKSIVADYFVICSASSTTQVRALAEYVDDEMGKHGYNILHRDIDGKWAALDYGCVIVHVFYNELREYYQIERLWDNGNNITVYEGE